MEMRLAQQKSDFASALEQHTRLADARHNVRGKFMNIHHRWQIALFHRFSSSFINMNSHDFQAIVG